MSMLPSIVTELAGQSLSTNEVSIHLLSEKSVLLIPLQNLSL